MFSLAGISCARDGTFRTYTSHDSLSPPPAALDEFETLERLERSEVFYALGK